MTISRKDEKEVQQILDDMMLRVSIGNGIPLGRLGLKPEQIKRIETKLKQDQENDTN